VKYNEQARQGEGGGEWACETSMSMVALARLAWRVASLMPRCGRRRRAVFTARLPFKLRRAGLDRIKPMLAVQSRRNESRGEYWQ
jgi:hypothetical protein